ncbi:DNA polymerase III subunit delta [Halovulum sp. GXIMD14793]
MKLSPRDLTAFIAKPERGLAGILIHGPDAMRVALKRQDLIKALVGPDGEAEMRLTRMSGGDLRGDPARLLDDLKATGFFPGDRVVFVEEATDTLTKSVQAALSDWAPGDATIVMTAGQLNARSSLRKLFEGDSRCRSAAIYADAASREEIEAALKAAGVGAVSSAAMEDLTALGRALDPGDFRQTMEKLALYKLGDANPVSSEDVAACAPTSLEAAMDDAINMVAEGGVEHLGELMRKLSGQGTTATSLCIAATRHFRQLHAAASSGQGPEAALSRARPPVFGPRRDRMARQARAIGVAKLESVLRMITDTDLALRSPRPLPDMAMVERLFIRIAMQQRR